LLPVYEQTKGIRKFAVLQAIQARENGGLVWYNPALTPSGGEGPPLKEQPEVSRGLQALIRDRGAQMDRSERDQQGPLNMRHTYTLEHFKLVSGAHHAEGETAGSS
jgi:hypothetical protein